MSANDKGVLAVIAAEAAVLRAEGGAGVAVAALEEARAAAKELRDAAEAVCERGTDSPLWQRLEAALVRFDGAQP